MVSKINLNEGPSSTELRSYADKIKARLNELKPLYEDQPLLGGLDMTEQARPEVIILTKLSEEALDYLVDIQDGQIRYNPSLEHMRIAREKLHITVLALYEETDMEQLFNETMDKGSDEANISIELDKFRDFNGRVVIQLKPGVLQCMIFRSYSCTTAPQGTSSTTPSRPPTYHYSNQRAGKHVPLQMNQLAGIKQWVIARCKSRALQPADYCQGCRS
jgi:hypothetical protein